MLKKVHTEVQKVLGWLTTFAEPRRNALSSLPFTTRRDLALKRAADHNGINAAAGVRARMMFDATRLCTFRTLHPTPVHTDHR